MAERGLKPRPGGDGGSEDPTFSGLLVGLALLAAAAAAHRPRDPQQHPCLRSTDRPATPPLTGAQDFIKMPWELDMPPERAAKELGAFLGMPDLAEGRWGSGGEPPSDALSAGSMLASPLQLRPVSRSIFWSVHGWRAEAVAPSRSSPTERWCGRVCVWAPPVDFFGDLG